MSLMYKGMLRLKKNTWKIWQKHLLISLSCFFLWISSILRKISFSPGLSPVVVVKILSWIFSSDLPMVLLLSLPGTVSVFCSVIRRCSCFLFWGNIYWCKKERETFLSSDSLPNRELVRLKLHSSLLCWLQGPK